MLKKSQGECQKTLKNFNSLQKLDFSYEKKSAFRLLSMLNKK